MRTGSTLVRVRPVEGGHGWEAVEPGSIRVLVRAKDQRSAIRGARTRLAQGGRVEVLDAEGRLVSTVEVPGPAEKPWWYLRSSPLSWFVAIALVVQSLFLVVDRDISGSTWWLSLATGLCALVLVAALIRSRYRDSETPQVRVDDHTRASP